jgi:hypothetical protein
LGRKGIYLEIKGKIKNPVPSRYVLLSDFIRVNKSGEDKMVGCDMYGGGETC